MKNLRENKIFNISMKVLKVFFFIFMIAFIIVVYLQRFSNNKVSFFNFRMFTVVSGSMEPKYKIGDVLIARDVAPSKIKVGDAISYLGNTGDVKGKIVTHQVVGIEKDENGKYLFRTQGLSNLIEDPIVSESQVYGVIVYRSVILSFVYGIIGTTIGFYLCIIIPLAGIIIYEIISVLLEKEDKKRKKELETKTEE